MKIIIKKTNDEHWDLVSEALKGEAGIVTATELRDGIVHYNANFPIYGALFLGVPETVVGAIE